eukprot:5786143-Pleurochrysis_carterae.AAC.1
MLRNNMAEVGTSRGRVAGLLLACCGSPHASYARSKTMITISYNAALTNLHRDRNQEPGRALLRRVAQTRPAAMAPRRRARADELSAQATLQADADTIDGQTRPPPSQPTDFPYSASCWTEIASPSNAGQEAGSEVIIVGAGLDPL